MVVVHVPICFADDGPTAAAETKRKVDYVRQVSDDVSVENVDKVVSPDSLHQTTGGFHAAESSRAESQDL